MPVNHTLAHRLTAEAQCDFIDRQLDRATAHAQKQQHGLLIAGSRSGHPRGGLMTAQVPRCVQWGMAVGRYPTTAVRDVMIAITSVVVDDQIVAPLVRMGRRAHTSGSAPQLHPGARTDHAPQNHGHRKSPAAGRMYEHTLIMMWSTGQAVLAAPLNAAVLGSTALGAAAGLCVGAVMAVLVGLLAPRTLLRHLCPSLAVLTHLTQNFEIMELAQRTRKRAEAAPHNRGLQERSYALWRAVEEQVKRNDKSIELLCPDGDGTAMARALDAQLLAIPRTRRLLGLGAYPHNNMDRLLAAREAFDNSEGVPPPMPQNSSSEDDADGAVGF